MKQKSYDEDHVFCIFGTHCLNTKIKIKIKDFFFLMLFLSWISIHKAILSSLNVIWKIQISIHYELSEYFCSKEKNLCYLQTQVCCLKIFQTYHWSLIFIFIFYEQVSLLLKWDTHSAIWVLLNYTTYSKWPSSSDYCASYSPYR